MNLYMNNNPNETTFESDLEDAWEEIEEISYSSTKIITAFFFFNIPYFLLF